MQPLKLLISFIVLGINKVCEVAYLEHVVDRTTFAVKY